MKPHSLSSPQAPMATRCLHAAMPLLVSALLLACGPGVVGTGGPITSVASLDVANLCSSSLNPALNCPANTAPTTGGQSAVETTWTDAAPTAQSADVRVQITDNSIVLRVSCSGLRFEGSWRLLSDGSVAFYGTYTDATQTLPVPGILRVNLALSESGFDVRASLFTTLDDLVAGPWFLRRTNLPPASTCPV